MKNNQGFTLIELMVVVIVVAILAAIGIPSYADYVRRGRITEAISGLSEMRVKLEQYFQDNRTYVGACAAGTVAALPANSAYFTFTCPTLTATTYGVTATGAGNMNGFIYTLDQSNTRRTTGLPSGWSGSGNTCWVIRKDGSC